MTFNVFAAAFSGFGLIGRRWGSFLLWCATWLVAVIAAALGAFVAMLGASSDSARAASSLILLPVVAVIGSVMAAAIQRAILRPGEKRFGSMRLGKAELWMFLVLLLLLGLQFAVSAGNAAAARALHLPGGLWAQLEGFAVNLALVLALSPFSLIAPAVFDRGGAGWRAGWELARGHRLRLLAVAAILGAVTLAAAWGAAYAMRWSLLREGNAMNPWFPLVLIIVPVAYTALFVVVMAPGAAAYVALNPSARGRVADVFD